MKKVRVKIWGSPLRCPVCQQDIFHFRKVTVSDRAQPGSQELGYLFECERCGYGSLFSGSHVTEYEASQARINPVLRQTAHTAEGERQ